MSFSSGSKVLDQKLPTDLDVKLSTHRAAQIRFFELQNIRDSIAYRGANLDESGPVTFATLICETLWLHLPAVGKFPGCHKAIFLVCPRPFIACHAPGCLLLVVRVEPDPSGALASSVPEGSPAGITRVYQADVRSYRSTELPSCQLVLSGNGQSTNTLDRAMNAAPEALARPGRRLAGCAYGTHHLHESGPLPHEVHTRT